MSSEHVHDCSAAGCSAYTVCGNSDCHDEQQSLCIDCLRDEVERLTAENERLERLYQETDGMRCHSSWVAQAQSLRAEVERLRDVLRRVLGPTGHLHAICYGSPDGCIPLCAAVKDAIKEDK